MTCTDKIAVLTVGVLGRDVLCMGKDDSCRSPGILCHPGFCIQLAYVGFLCRCIKGLGHKGKVARILTPCEIRYPVECDLRRSGLTCRKIPAACDILDRHRSHAEIHIGHRRVECAVSPLRIGKLGSIHIVCVLMCAHIAYCRLVLSLADLCPRRIKHFGLGIEYPRA